MDPSKETHSVINNDDQSKLSYTSVINFSPVRTKSLQQPLKKVESNINEDLFTCNDSYDEDESKPKTRKRNPENWKQNVRKRNKNKGLEYVKANGEICAKKKLGPPCNCKEKCYLKIGLDSCEKIFQNFWKLGDHALQNAYIAGCVRIFLPKHCYKKDGIPSRRFFSRNFHVTVNGVDTEVCKQAFLNMHAISNGRLDRLLKKKQEIGNTGFDERGRHNNKVNKIPIEKIKLVHKHIDTIRLRAGYAGKRKPKKVEILPGLLNIRTMYRSYREEMITKGLEPVCEYRYRKIFHTDFHLDFGKTVVSNNVKNEFSHGQQQQSQLSLEQQQLASQVQLSHSTLLLNRQLNKDSKKTSFVKKFETLTNTELEDVSINEQVNSSMKPDKQMNIYTHLDIQETKEFNIQTADTGSYVLPQEVFRLDYTSTFNNSQQNWIFSNQN